MIASVSSLIEAFDARLTEFDGRYFLVSKDGTDAYPISADERRDFRNDYARAMRRARIIRWVAWLSFLPLLILMPRIDDVVLPGGATIGKVLEWNLLGGIILFGIPAAGIFQYMITSDVMLARFQRTVSRRYPTRLPQALLPNRSRLTALGKTLMLAGGAFEIGSRAFYLFFSNFETERAHMRVLHGMTSGNEPVLAHITGNLARLGFLLILLGAIAFFVGRKLSKERAAEAKAGDEAKA